MDCLKYLTCFPVEEEEDKYRHFVDEETTNYMPPIFIPIGSESIYHTPTSSLLEEKDLPLKESFFYTPNQRPQPYIIDI